MSRRIKVLIGVLVAVLMLTIGGTAIALADTTGTTAATDNTGPRLSLLERVAKLLNIPQDDLTKAFNQAQQEMKQEAQQRWQERVKERKAPTQEQLDKMQEQREQMRQKMLDKAVEKGIISDNESLQIENWWNGRPPAVDKLGPRGGFCPPAFRFRK